MLHAFLDGEVDHCLILAVVYAGQSGLLALAVYHLHFRYGLGGEVLGGHLGVVAEEFLAVDEDFRYSLAVGRDASVASHFHARHLLEKVFHHCVVGGVEGVGVEFDGVFLGYDCRLHSFYYELPEHRRLVVELECGKLYGLGGVGYREICHLSVHACHRRLKHVTAWGDFLEDVAAVGIGHRAADYR